jgi:amidase
MTDLHYEEIGTIAALIKSQQLSPVELTRALLDRIASLDGQLRSYVHVTAEAALGTARLAEREIAKGEYRGPLHGVPIAVKDLFWTKDVPTSGGMAIYRDFRPARDATAVHRLRKTGAVILGKLKTTEGAYSDHHPSVPPPVNPWDSAYWTGISSSGPGVALASGLCFGALATDTGGSIRWPSGANGLTGVKPTWGRVSRDGAFALAPSMDHVGSMARSAADAALLLEAIAGPDPRDPTALQGSMTLAAPPLEGMTIGVDSALNETDVDAPVREVLRQAISTLRDLGGVIVEIQLPELSQAAAAWPDLCAVEAAVVHENTYPALRASYGPVLAQVIERGRSLSAIELHRLQLQRMRLQGAFDELFARVDLLLCAVQPFAPLTLQTLGVLGEQPETIARLQRFTAPFNMTGSPTVTLPGGYDSHGMPIGFQLVGARLREDAVISAGISYQQATRWHRRHPDL